MGRLATVYGRAAGQFFLLEPSSKNSGIQGV